MTETFLIKATNISHAFQANRPVLHQVSLQIKPQEIITLIGPNGAGKSTLLKVLLGLIQPDQGEVLQPRKLVVGYMPQKIQIEASLPLSVKRFLTLGTRPTNFDSSITNELGIEHLLKHTVQSLSGGELQKVLLVRAILRKPDLLVLDEPTQGVDLQGQTELYHYLDEIRHRIGCSILMVSHDLHIVMKKTDQVICLNQHICCAGTPHDVSQNPAFLELLGEEAEEIAIYGHHHKPDSCDDIHSTHNH